MTFSFCSICEKCPPISTFFSEIMETALTRITGCCKVQSVRSLGLSINPWPNLHPLLLSFFLELFLQAQISYDFSNTGNPKMQFFYRVFAVMKCTKIFNPAQDSLSESSPDILSYQNMLCTTIITRLEVFSCSWIPLLPSGGRFSLEAFHSLMITAISSIHQILRQVLGICNFYLSF